MRAWLGAAIIAAAITAAAWPGVAVATPINSKQPAISGAPQVGNTLTCEPGTWTNTAGDGDVFPTDYKWFHATNLSSPIHDGKQDDTYTPGAADIGTTLVCQETEEDYDDSTTQTARSAASTTVVPVANVKLTHYSPAVSGSIGESLAGATVSVSLNRPVGDGTVRTVGSATATTSSSGSWSANLAPANPASGSAHGVLDNDTVTVAYTPPPSSTTAVPPGATYPAPSFGGPSSEISSAGTSVVSSAGVDCASVHFYINGTTESTTADSEGDCRYTPGTALTDAAHVQVALSEAQVADDGSTSHLITVDDVGLLGEPSGAPRCSGDLVTTTVTCASLNGGNFAVSYNGGAAVALTTAGDPPGSGTFTGFALVPGLKKGGKVTLDETSPTATTRHLTTLTLPALRVDVAADGGVSGSCQPSAEFAGGSPLCPASGTFTVALGGGPGIVDDRSGGLGIVTIPFVSNLTPGDGDSLGASFTAYADVTGGGTTAQLLAQTKSLKLSLRAHGAAAATLSKAMPLTTDADGVVAKLPVSGLAAAQYFADWLLTDVNGDTSDVQNVFVVQASSPTAAVSHGPLSTAAGRTTLELVTCTTTIARRHGHAVAATSCTLSWPSRGQRVVDVTVARDRTVYAHRTTTVNARVATVSLRGHRRLRPGRYRVTIATVINGHRIVVYRRRLRIQ
jgi:hypothetical protein